MGFTTCFLNTGYCPADLESLMRSTLGALANFNEDEKMILTRWTAYLHIASFVYKDCPFASSPPLCVYILGHSVEPDVPLFT